ncbi:helix-turn-helix domain-containing protein [Cereibacter sphaeroides]|uniref:helix-turn-helix domain-containing protein n=1 Tax=Cereibacter sphaeroides TaxID=1063 RepID=UPI001F271E81|nr:helix-turn-helix domain-containing protein [Cereibacter sphaeroides]MCE6958038.1 helix-turn-helix domain-containing protein [Cereibacter sphaeroides]MCE6971973.1 helix-turn-helix domain-containing protein [Cereibacter sphaeroides]
MSSLHSPKPTGRRLSPRESAEICAAHGRGESVTALARRFGVARPTIYRALERQGRAVAAGDSTPVSIRLGADERVALDALSRQLGLSRSGVARRVLRLASGFLEPEPELVAAAGDLARQMKAVGGNLNQIAAHLNREARLQGRASPDLRQLAEIEAAERELKALAREVERFLVHAARRRRARVESLLGEGEAP